MTQDRRVRADSKGAVKLEDHAPAGNATAFFAEPPNLTQVAQTLAAHGGGALSVHLALDLVLNDVVEQARTATGATGAAIALIRDGELTCRASSGENAPDLGVRVDSTSALASACISTGEIQQCQDTDSDARVNAEACRRLGVRSMLIAPLVDGQKLIGLIQVFSAWPNAFGKREISALQVLAGRIAESNREAETGMTAPMEHPEMPAEPSEMKLAEASELKIEPSQVEPTQVEPIQVEPIQFEPIQVEPIQEEKSEEVVAGATEPRKEFDLWGAILVVLVIVAAMALGLVIGWRKAADFARRSAGVKTSAPANVSANVVEPPASQNVASVDSSPAHAASADAPVAKGSAAKPEPPPGGLIVTENGKVVYRSPSGTAQPAASHRSERSLIHRVEPEYPAEAKAQHVQGPVVLDIQILGDGAVGTVAVVSGDPLLTPSAIDAVKRWRYEPASANGQAIESQARVTVKFTLPQS
jgi:TonB family protein